MLAQDKAPLPVPQGVGECLPPDMPGAGKKDTRNHRSLPPTMANITDYLLNCSLWLTNLPAHTTHHELLSHIRNVDKVYSLKIFQWKRCDGLTTSVAELVFFHHVGARLFRARCCGPSSSELTIGGMRVQATFNRKFPVSEEQANTHAHRSRVLIIAGPKHIVNLARLGPYFADWFPYNIDEIVTLHEGQHHRMCEWRFAGYHGQAHTAYMAIVENSDFMRSGVTVRFGLAPCDVPSCVWYGRPQLMLQVPGALASMVAFVGPQDSNGCFCCPVDWLSAGVRQDLSETESSSQGKQN